MTQRTRPFLALVLFSTALFFSGVDAQRNKPRGKNPAGQSIDGVAIVPEQDPLANPERDIWNPPEIKQNILALYKDPNKTPEQVLEERKPYAGRIMPQFGGKPGMPILQVKDLPDQENLLSPDNIKASPYVILSAKIPKPKGMSADEYEAYKRPVKYMSLNTGQATVPDPMRP